MKIFHKISLISAFFFLKKANEEVEITYAGIVKDTDTGVIFPTAGEWKWIIFIIIVVVCIGLMNGATNKIVLRNFSKFNKLVECYTSSGVL